MITEKRSLIPANCGVASLQTCCGESSLPDEAINLFLYVFSLFVSYAAVPLLMCGEGGGLSGGCYLYPLAANRLLLATLNTYLFLKLYSSSEPAYNTMIVK